MSSAPLSTSTAPPAPTSNGTAVLNRDGSAGPQVTGPESLSELEREVLEEYALLLENLNKLGPLLSSLSMNPTAGILDGLRMLERKTSLVSTLLKASVYSIVLQQEMLEEG
ncbi:hypothetical protein MMC30_003641 [Trapelia coarctata]|nr:hypothetical protein [Trapelia coarctata]